MHLIFFKSKDLICSFTLYQLTLTLEVVILVGLFVVCIAELATRDNPLGKPGCPPVKLGRY